MPDPTASAEAELRRLLDIMAALRDPATGCPWDKEQSFDTIAPYTIEEAYEVADAIAERDFAALPDELGDLLFQVVYHARMAEEAGLFGFADIAKMHQRQDDTPPSSRVRRCRRTGCRRADGRLGSAEIGRTRRADSRPARWPGCRSACPP